MWRQPRRERFPTRRPISGACEVASLVSHSGPKASEGQRGHGRVSKVGNQAGCVRRRHIVGETLWMRTGQIAQL